MNPFPPGVSVHGIKSSAKGSNAPHAFLSKVGLKLFYKGDTALGGGIPAIKDGMDGNIGYTLVPGHVNEGQEMSDMAVHAPIGEQS